MTRTGIEPASTSLRGWLQEPNIAPSRIVRSVSREGIEPSAPRSNCFTDSLDYQVQPTLMRREAGDVRLKENDAFRKELSLVHNCGRVRWKKSSYRSLVFSRLRSQASSLFSSSPRNRTLSNSFEDCRANPSHSQAMYLHLAFVKVSMSGIEPDLRPSQGRVRIHYTSQTYQWCG